jgi:hypothetical protein
MSARGNCCDNAAMESWNHSLKVEAIHGERFHTREQSRAHVFEYIDLTTIETAFTRRWTISAQLRSSRPMLLNRVSEIRGQDQLVLPRCRAAHR